MSSPRQMQDGPGPAARLHVVILRLHQEGQAEVLADAPASFPESRLPVFLVTLAKFINNPFSYGRGVM